jgi:hypothetical protein
MEPVPELLLNHSRIAPNGNGNPQLQLTTEAPTDGQKLWAAVILGFVFAILSSPLAQTLTSKALVSVGCKNLIAGGNEIPGLLIRTVIFILVVRILLW